MPSIPGLPKINLSQIGRTKADGGSADHRLEKHGWIAELVAGKTFADIGGLWGTVNETVTIAARAGAAEVTMVDIQKEGSKWWQAFHARCAEKEVSDYRSVVADIRELDALKTLGTFDIVHCSGILYHVTDPIALVRNITRITREHFVLGSMLIPEVIDNAEGRLETPQGMLRCVPLLAPDERRILGRHFADRSVNVAGLTAPDPVYLDPKSGRIRTGPWWYLFTAETLQEMCRLCGAEVLKTSTMRSGAQNILCRKL